MERKARIAGQVSQPCAAAAHDCSGNSTASTKNSMQAAKATAGGAPRRPAAAEPPKEILALDPEKLILEWPEPAARLIDEPL